MLLNMIKNLEINLGEEKIVGRKLGLQFILLPDN